MVLPDLFLKIENIGTWTLKENLYLSAGPQFRISNYEACLVKNDLKICELLDGHVDLVSAQS